MRRARGRTMVLAVGLAALLATACAPANSDTVETVTSFVTRLAARLGVDGPVVVDCTAEFRAGEPLPD